MKKKTFKMADIYAKILIFSCSAGGYKKLKFVANCVILRRLNKLNPVFYFRKKNFLVKIIVLTVF